LETFFEHFCSAIEILLLRKYDETHTPEIFQSHCDELGDLLLLLWGDRRVTNCFHDMIAGHMYDMMKDLQEFGLTLAAVANDGLEHQNGDLKHYDLAQTQRGGFDGTLKSRNGGRGPLKAIMQKCGRDSARWSGVGKAAMDRAEVARKARTEANRRRGAIRRKATLAEKKRSRKRSRLCCDFKLI
jgi:hypothetical protein